MDLNGKTAIVTGGAKGLGAAFSEALLQRGANVVIADVRTSKGIDAVNEFLGKHGTGRSLFVHCDVTKEDDMERLFQKTKAIYGNVDIVVNNAGIGDAVNWRKSIEINLAGVVKGSVLGLDYMNKNNGGQGGLIVNIGSTAGLAVVAFEPVYSATKAGVVMYTRSIAARSFETSDQDIRVVCLCPSFVNTDMAKQAFTAGDRTDEMSQVGIMDVDRAVQGFMKLVDDTHNNGGILALTPKSMFYRYNKQLNAKL